MSRVFTTIETLKPAEDHGDQLDAGAFPIDALPPVMRDIAENLADVHRLDVALPSMAAVAALSGAIGKSVKITGAANGRDTPCNVFIIAGAPKSYGKGASSHAVQPILDASKERFDDFQENERGALLAERAVLEKVQKKLIAECAEAVEMTGSADRTKLNETMQRLDAIEGLLKWPPSFHIGAATGAALEETLSRNDEQIFSYSPEAGDVVRIALGRYTKDGAADFDLLLSGYSVESISPARAGRGFKNLTPCISTLWLVQPSLLRELYASEEVLERGLSARVLAFKVEHEEIPEDDGILRMIDPARFAAWNDCILAVLRGREYPAVFTCTPEARELFRAWHNEAVQLRNGSFRDIEGELGRWRENAIRLSGILAVAAGEIEITEQLAADAIRLCRWCVFSSLSLLASGRAIRMTENKQRLFELLKNGPVTVRELKRSHGFQAAELRHITGLNPDDFILETHKPENGGRPSEIMRLAI
jgi:hypothetical protein